MMQDIQDEPSISEPGFVGRFWKRCKQNYQLLLDRWTPHTMGRWLSTVLLLAAFMARIVIKQEPDTPKELDFHLKGIEGYDSPGLPTTHNEEFRPFMRRLPEFKFWYSVTKATVIAVICTFFDCFNIPVFWPILVLYFITLFCVTMKRQIRHMIRYRYIPFTMGKPRYQVHEDTPPKVANSN